MGEDDKDWRTRELERLGVLAAAVSGLREDLGAYRRVLNRYLRRATQLGGLLIVAIIALIVVIAASALELSAQDELIREMRSSAQEHRLRNEQLHECLVQLVFYVIETAPEDRDEIVNPCPESLVTGD